MIPKSLFRAVILGAPGSGKGTISSRIVRDFDVYHLSSGNVLRSHVQNKTPLGLKVKRYLDEGNLVPESLMIDLIVKELEKMKDSNWLLDGFPRTRYQAEELFKVEPVKVAINLNVPYDVILERLKGRWTHIPSGRIYHTEFNPPKVSGKDDLTGEELVQRDDDRPETVLKRLQEYSQITTPLLKYCRELGILKDFHGRESNEIWPRVYEFLCQYMEPKPSKGKVKS